MRKLGKTVFLFTLFLVIAVITACSDDASDGGDSEDARGGELNRIIIVQPPTVDPMASTETATRDTARLVFVSLLVLNADFEPVPFLAEEVENEDNQKFTFHLREGVQFHNGEEMTAEDVVASMNRWKEINNKAKKVI